MENMATMNLPQDVNGKVILPHSKAYIGATGEEVTVEGFLFRYSEGKEVNESIVSDIVCRYEDGGVGLVPSVTVQATEPTEEEMASHLSATLIINALGGLH